jgi:hypothetical protein
MPQTEEQTCDECASAGAEAERYFAYVQCEYSQKATENYSYAHEGKVGSICYGVGVAYGFCRGLNVELFTHKFYRVACIDDGGRKDRDVYANACYATYADAMHEWLLAQFGDAFAVV